MAPTKRAAGDRAAPPPGRRLRVMVSTPGSSNPESPPSPRRFLSIVLVVLFLKRPKSRSTDSVPASLSRIRRLMDAASLVKENTAMAARIAELEEQLMLAQQREVEASKEITELKELVASLGAQNDSLAHENEKLTETIVDTRDELADVTQMAEYLDGMRIEADDQLTEAQNANEHLVEQNQLLEAQLVAMHQQVEHLQEDLDEAHNEFDGLMEIHMGHLFPQPIAMVAPDDEEQGVSGLDYEAPLSPMDNDVLSDAGSHMPDAE